MSSYDISVPTHDGQSFSAVVVMPPSGRGPGLLLFHAIFGVNPVMREYASLYAQQGYVVLLPDLFWRQEANVALNEKSASDMKRGMELFAKFDVDNGIEDLRSSLTAVKALDACSGQVVAVGYCFGGRMAYLMAAHTEIDAAVSYYGTAIEKHLEVACLVHRPLMLHMPDADTFVLLPAQQAIKQALSENANATVYSYPGIGHAFARVGSPNYDAKATNLADKRTAEFLKKHLEAVSSNDGTNRDNLKETP